MAGKQTCEFPACEQAASGRHVLEVQLRKGGQVLLSFCSEDHLNHVFRALRRKVRKVTG